MAIKNKRGQWACSFCNKAAKNPAEADACRDRHDLVYIPMERTDVNRLLMYIYQPNPELITDSMVKTIKRSLKFALDREQKV